MVLLKHRITDNILYTRNITVLSIIDIAEVFETSETCRDAISPS